MVVADMVADMAADMEVHMVADMEVDKVADMVGMQKKRRNKAKKLVSSVAIALR